MMLNSEFLPREGKILMNIIFSEIATNGFQS